MSSVQIGHGLMLGSRTVALALVLAVFAVPTAGRADTSGPGIPGWISTSTAAVSDGYISDIFAASISGFANIELENLWLYASPASAQTQIVTVTNAVHNCISNLGPNYAFMCPVGAAATGAWQIAPGAWRWVGTPSNLVASFATQPQGYYFSEVTVTWQTPSGVVLGRTVHDYQGAREGRCLSVRCRWANQFGYTFPSTWIP
jgi:hypothetical protein